MNLHSRSKKRHVRGAISAPPDTFQKVKMRNITRVEIIGGWLRQWIKCKSVRGESFSLSYLIFSIKGCDH